MARSQDELESLEARLLAAGAPPHVVKHVLAQRIDRRLYLVPLGVMLLAMVGGFVLGSALVWRPLEALTQANARAHALQIGGLMYWTNFGLSLLPALFGWIFACGWLAAAITGLSRPILYSTFAASVLDRRASVASAVRRSIEHLSGELDPERFVRRFSAGWGPLFAWPAAPLMLLSIALATRDVQAHAVFTADGYVRSPFLPWASPEPELWSDAVTVELGCNHVTGKNADDYVVYRVAFADGASVSVGDSDFMTAMEGSWLDQVEVIDAALEDAGADFQRWKEDYLHPECLQAYRRTRSSTDYGRIVRLLRVGELEPS